MKRIFLLLVVVIFVAMVEFSFAQEQQEATMVKEQQEMKDDEQETDAPVLILQAAQQRKKDSVAVIANLDDDILKVIILARMYATKPNIYNVTLEGSGIGKLSPKERRTLFPTAEDEEIEFKTRKLEAGFIRLTPKEAKRKLKGTLTKEVARFKIPKDRIRPKKRYFLNVKIESLQNPGQYKKFKFELKKLAEELLKESQ